MDMLLLRNLLHSDLRLNFVFLLNGDFSQFQEKILNSFIFIISQIFDFFVNALGNDKILSF